MTSSQNGSFSGRRASHPSVATLAVTIHNDTVLLVRRNDSSEGAHWSFPGGEIEWGETVLDSAQREMAIEAGVSTRPIQAFSAHDVIETDETGQPCRHIVFIAVICAYIAGEPCAGDDTLEARWFALQDLASLKLKLGSDVFEIVRRAAALHRENGLTPSNCTTA